MLTRYACYLLAQNGDPRKPEIVLSKNVFEGGVRSFKNARERRIYIGAW